MAKPKIIKDTAERWLLTYADLMNLLLIFFIILFAMSKTDQAKYNQLAEALSNAFGTGTPISVTQTGGPGSSIIDLPSTAPSTVIPSKMEKEQMEKVKEKVEELIKKEGLGSNVQVSLAERGVEISIQDEVLFDPGSANIKLDSKKTVEKIGSDILSEIPGKQIRVEGHTDSDPIKTAKFPDNQELSTARANNVLRILASVGIDKKLLSSVGYGENRPMVPNNSVTNKAKNRRVDIVILKDIYDTSEAGQTTNNATQSSDTKAAENTSAENQATDQTTEEENQAEH